MKKWLCWLLNHDIMTTTTRSRICVRCGRRETLRYFGDLLVWEEVAATPIRSAKQ